MRSTLSMFTFIVLLLCMPLMKHLPNAHAETMTSDEVTSIKHWISQFNRPKQILLKESRNDAEKQKAPLKVLFLFFHDKGSHFASMKPLMYRYELKFHYARYAESNMANKIEPSELPSEYFTPVFLQI